MAKWNTEYRVGELVEARVILATGAAWQAGRVIRKTASGFPVVNIGGSYTWVCDRKSDIRKAETTHTH